MFNCVDVWEVWEEGIMAHRGGQPQRMIGDYIVTTQIGAGSFAVVWKARHKLHGNEVAIKEIATEKLNPKLQESLLSEIAILKRTTHPNIIRLHDIVEVSSVEFEEKLVSGLPLDSDWNSAQASSWSNVSIFRKSMSVLSFLSTPFLSFPFPFAALYGPGIRLVIILSRIPIFHKTGA